MRKGRGGGVFALRHCNKISDSLFSSNNVSIPIPHHIKKYYIEDKSKEIFKKIQNNLFSTTQASYLPKTPQMGRRGGGGISILTTNKFY